MERKRKFHDIDKLQQESISAGPCTTRCVPATLSMINHKLAVDPEPSSVDKRTNVSAPLIGGSEPRKLCGVCAKLDLNEIFSSRPRSRRGRLVMKLGSLTPVSKTPSCTLCRFFAAMLPKTFEAEDQGEEYGLFAFRGQQSYAYPKMGDQVIAGVLRLADFHQPNWTQTVQSSLDSTGFIWGRNLLGPEPEFQIRSVETARVDFNIISDWLDICEWSHTKVCVLSKKSLVNSLRVICCTDRKIIWAPEECEYVALSYLWGSSPGAPEEQSNDLPSQLPTTIEDAITVTLGLGFDYLWVDRYCIRQDDKSHKHHQIRHMDMIYRNAEVTIIDAAGDDPHSGLPGISRRPRISQQKAIIGDYLLASSLPDPRKAIESSKWMTRGWTYQEGLLSRRRLLFTDYQIYYECYGMHCYETVDVPLLELHVNSHQRFRSAIPGIFPSRGVGRLPWDFLPRVSEYSTKFLTYDSDVLNGISGILRSFEGIEYGVQHYWGVPIISTFVKSAGGKVATEARDPRLGLAVGLCWFLSKPGMRRKHFPSWSWAGWRGKVQAESRWYEYDTMSKDPVLKVSVELSDGHILAWEEFQQSVRWADNPSVLSRFIHITALATLIKFEVIDRDSEDSHFDGSQRTSNILAVFELHDGGKAYGRWNPTTMLEDEESHLKILTRTYAAILLGAIGKKLDPLFLIVRKIRGVRERIGTVEPVDLKTVPLMRLKQCTIRLG